MKHVDAHTYEEFYRRISATWRTPAKRKALLTTDRIIVALFAIVFVGTCIGLFIQHDVMVARFFVVPALTFVLISIMRVAINEPRPVQTCSINPLVQKDERGKSFPSRHVASATIISCALTAVSIPAGVIAWIGTAILAYARIAEGVHYPRDVVWAIIISLACGLVGFVVI